MRYLKGTSQLGTPGSDRSCAACPQSPRGTPCRRGSSAGPGRTSLRKMLKQQPEFKLSARGEILFKPAHYIPEPKDPASSVSECSHALLRCQRRRPEPILSPAPCTLNPKPPNPKPYTRNPPKLQTLNPPSTLRSPGSA